VLDGNAALQLVGQELDISREGSITDTFGRNRAKPSFHRRPDLTPE
jgi:hypothetical protein